MADPLDRLRPALADRYRIERELGAGGMATVYLAEDLKHQRHVAIKLLRPELAVALGPERFLREITLTARLEHPHILPLLDSGEADGLLYYVMPYVEGETLRDRLNREKQLPVEDALRIAREVADALGAAHARGVVHRDIKPENILLAGGHARVADFGVARALTAAGVERLTETGLAVGTAVYMSPEQASGEADVDGRSDLYSLACVLYEMLVGQPPYTGASAYAVRARQAIDPVPPIRTVRDAVPAAVEEAVTRALEKVPADRFATAADFVEALAHPKARTPRRRRARVLTIVAIPILAAGIAVSMLRDPGIGRSPSLIAGGAVEPNDEILIVDFASPSDALLGRTAAELLRTSMMMSGLLKVPSETDIAGALTRMGREPDQGLQADDARALAEREGYELVVLGEVVGVGQGYLITARVIAPASGEVLGRFRAEASTSNEFVKAMDELSAAMRARIGESLGSIRRSTPLSQVTTTSLEALKAYHEGRRLRLDEDRWDDAIPWFERAIELDSTFGSAYRGLAITLGNMGRDPERVAALREAAYRHRDRVTPAERVDIEAGMIAERHWRGELGPINLYDMLIELYENFLRMHEPTYNHLNNLGLYYSEVGRLNDAIRTYRRALELQHTVLTHANLIVALLSSGDLSAAERELAALHERSGDVFLWYTSRALAAIAREELDTAHEIYEQGAARHGDQFHAWQRSIRSLVVIDAARGRLADAEHHLREIDARGEAVGVLPQVIGGVRALAVTTVFVTPAGLEDARGRENDWDVALRRAALSLAEGKPLDAVDAIQRAHRGNREHPDRRLLWTLASAYVAAGMPDSAAVAWERLVTSSDNAGGLSGHWLIVLPHAHRELGLYHERRGESGRAIQHLSRFVELWSAADPPLQPIVQDARQRIAALREYQ
jgi:serine/threonine protein kinase/tetratricopeptide (TPR) repeat protein